jgi:hypothetical protein
VSREVRRVPLDFDWPLDTLWGGYVMPDRLKRNPCPDCENGSTAAAEWLRTFCRRIQDLGDDIRDQQSGRPMHPCLAEDPNPFTTRGAIDPVTRRWTELPRIIRPTADILPLLTGLTGRSEKDHLHPLSGDNSYRIVMKLVAAAGLDPDTWGICTTCAGEALLDAHEGQSADIEAWEPTEPPAGDGWQLWQTLSEGSPISPVFPTEEDLARWMTSPAYTWGAAKHGRPSYEQALQFVRDGWAPSVASSPGSGPVSGVEWVGTTGTGA